MQIKTILIVITMCLQEWRKVITNLFKILKQEKYWHKFEVSGFSCIVGQKESRRAHWK